ncbi:Serine/threonine-protein phosphatase 7 long form [Glycine max]|nr:Serine/threonine-protein phosphatase 7 long form [Glycine max]
MWRVYHYSSRCVSFIRPQEGELEGNVVKLSWLAQHFSNLNNHDGNVKQLQRFTRACILRFIGGVLFVNKSSSRVSLRYLQFLRDFEQCITYAWGPVVLAYLYREMCSATDYKVKSIGGGCDVEISILAMMILEFFFVWEPYTITVMAALPPICVVGSVAWFVVVPLICFHVVEWHQTDRVLRQFGMQQPIPECPSQPQNLHGITLKGKQDENWFQLLAPMIIQWNNRAEFRVDVYPRQEGLLSFNSDYMVWYRRNHTGTSASEHSFNGVAETHPHFSWPTMTPSQQHDAPMATPNASLALQWNVPGAIPDMGDLLGVDLREEFSVEAEQVEAGRHHDRRNPDRQARRWDRPCGTSSRHHGHHND